MGQYLKALDAVIKKFRIIDLTCEYSGGGDSGSIDDLMFTTALEDKNIREPLDDALYRVFCAVCDWYNNEGGGGSLTVVNGVVTKWNQYYNVSSREDVIEYKAEDGDEAP